MCNLCNIPNRPAAYPAFQFKDKSGNLIAEGRRMTLCRHLARRQARTNGWKIVLEPRQDESSLSSKARIACDEIYAAGA